MKLDPGATAWVLASTALVLLMVPGVALFYGGMVRANHVLGMVMQNVTGLALVSVLWVVAGFSLAFGDGSPYLGDLSLVGLENLPAQLPGGEQLAIPPMAFAGLQMMYAVLTVALLTGAAADRWRFGSFLGFVALWTLLGYAPVAHWVFAPQGWAAARGVLDFAGGAVVHVNSGAAAIAIALVLGRRQGWPHPAMRPHNMPMTMLGAGLLWFGWLGFNGGAAYAADGPASAAVLNTVVAGSAGLLTWILTERIRYGKPTTLGAASGAISGLVAITPAAGHVSPLGALVVGVAAGAVCALLVGFKTWIGLDDSLDVAAVHLGGGAIGMLCVGLFASTAVNPAGADGLFYGGGYAQLGVQALVVAAVAAYSFVVTLLIVGFLDRLVGNRVSPRAEAIGLDLAQHGEVAYRLAPAGATGPQAAGPRDDDPPQHRSAGMPIYRDGALP